MRGALVQSLQALKSDLGLYVQGRWGVVGCGKVELCGPLLPISRWRGTSPKTKPNFAA